MIRQEFIRIEKVELLNKVQQMKNERYRLAQICVTRLDEFVFLYSFEKDYSLINLSFSAGFDEPVTSIGWLYPYAFLYENEIKDLFGVIVTDMNVDFKGHLYKTSIKTPFNPAVNEVAQDG